MSGHREDSSSISRKFAIAKMWTSQRNFFFGGAAIYCLLFSSKTKGTREKGGEKDKGKGRREGKKEKGKERIEGKREREERRRGKRQERRRREKRTKEGERSSCLTEKMGTEILDYKIVFT